MTTCSAVDRLTARAPPRRRRLLHFAALSAEIGAAQPSPAFTFSMPRLRPTSRAAAMIKSCYPHARGARQAAVILDPGPLANPHLPDFQGADPGNVRIIKVLSNLMKALALSRR